MYRVLVVDDEPAICKALEMGLSPEDFEVDVSTDGNGGILLGSQRPYDILIADLCLPDMDGLDVIREIKRISPEIIPIVITGNGSMESSIEAIHLEVSDYLEKPLTMESVKSAITRGIEKRAMKRKTMRKKLQQMLEIYKEKFSDLSGAEANTRNTRSDQLSETIPMFVHQINNPLMSIVGSAELGMLKLSDTGA
ncbi:MAG: response regulator, partial [Deltaproteobacteria bacterium]|nr:response regulator [Deltaproteobacteria bacterium]